MGEQTVPVQSTKSRPPVTAFGGNDWGDEWHTRQHILSRLGQRGWPVIYSTGIHSIWDGNAGWYNPARWNGYFEKTGQVTLYEPGIWQMEIPRLSWWSDWMAAAHARVLRRWTVRASSEKLIVYVFHPRYWPLVESMKDAFVVFHPDDNFAAMPGWTRRRDADQAALVERADLILATSPGVARALPGSGPARAHQLPNGADVDAFERGREFPCPPDLENVPHPRIGYMGNLNEKVDFGLIRDLAQTRLDWQFVFLGREMGEPHLSQETREARATCHTLSNVHFLGRRPRQELPAYVSHMDVNIMCYRTGGDGWWRDVYPLKLHEYLAVGKPIVTAPLEVCRQFTSALAIASTPAEWLERIQHAIEQGGVGMPDARIQVARDNSWDKRVDEIEALIWRGLEAESQDRRKRQWREYEPGTEPRQSGHW